MDKHVLFVSLLQTVTASKAPVVPHVLNVVLNLLFYQGTIWQAVQPGHESVRLSYFHIIKSHLLRMCYTVTLLL
jgi:hypothetical protein